MRFSPLLCTVLLAPAVAAQGFGAVYTINNDPAGNEVAVSLRLPNGNLLSFASFSADGTGTGAGLGSQGALAASDDGRTLLAVNPGSNEVTMFRVLFGVFLWRQDTEASDGQRPTSVALHDDLVYVLNADSDSIRGFRRHGGNLQPIPGASYALSQSGVAAAQVGFSPDGRFLVVTERATNRIDVFRVHHNGTLGAGNFQPSVGATPFGFAFRDDGTLVVTEAAGGAPGASALSSYRIHNDGSLQVLTGGAATGQAAACWAAIPRGGHYAYTANTGDGTVTGFRVTGNGQLQLLDPSGVSGALGAAARPVDLDFSPNGRVLYVHDSAGDRIRAFHRANDGSLQLLATEVGVAHGSGGLLVR